MSIDLKKDIHIRSWREVYEELYEAMDDEDAKEYMQNDGGKLKDTILDNAIGTYEAELESISKWMNSNLGYSVTKFTLEDSDGIETLDLGYQYPTLGTYIILNGAVFGECSTGILTVEGKNYSRRSKDNTFYKVVYYEKLRQDLLSKGIHKVNAIKVH